MSEINKEGVCNGTLPTFENEMLKGFGLINEPPAEQTPAEAPAEQTPTEAPAEQTPAEAEHIAYKETEKADLKRRVEKTFRDLKTKQAEPQPLLHQVGGRNFLHKENLHMLMSPRKSGKSATGSILMAGVIVGVKDFGIDTCVSNSKVVYIDTEQSEYDQYKVREYVVQMCEDNGLSRKELEGRFFNYHFKGEETDKLMPMTEIIIEEVKPDFLFIDGVKEYVFDINKPEESTKIIRQWEALTAKYKCAIMLVIHTNKLKSDEQGNEENYVSRGHLGSELENKLSDGFCCVKEIHNKGTQNEKAIFRVVNTISRNEPIHVIYFQRDSERNGLPIKCNSADYGNVNNDSEFEVLVERIEKVLGNSEKKRLDTTTFKEELAKQYKRSVSTIENKYLKKYKDRLENKVYKIVDEKQFHWYYLVGSDDVKQMEIPLLPPDENESCPF